ncbi:hypothetical protein, partial [Roseovarius salis]|uniref:hypothetical protein n=1 Tax=Roseovarius salis TaxID=3376063 RepID=UPI0037C8B01B
MKRSSAILTLSLLPAAAAAEPPLSAIDWLAEPAPVTVAQPLLQPLGQAPVSDGVKVPDVTVTPLDTARADAVGLLPTSTTGLPRDLWAASATGRLEALLDDLTSRPPPAVQALYYTLLLAEADPPADAGAHARFLRARLAALRRFGAVDAALALVERAGPATPALFDTWLDLALLKGTENAPCAALARTPGLSERYASRIFCMARAGEWSTAALTYDTARAVGALTPRETTLLGRFLDPATPEEGAGLAPPREMTPLLFRLYEAAGDPMPTRSLPRAFAVADLRGTMGWKAEIEAAERLARTGALPANRLLGLYTERAPAASGGVWDRVEAIQTFDAAVESDAAAMAAALPGAWQAMSDAGLGVVFATLYGADLAKANLPDHAALAHEIVLLSPTYESAARMPGPQTRLRRFLDGLASGAPDA